MAYILRKKKRKGKKDVEEKTAMKKGSTFTSWLNLAVLLAGEVSTVLGLVVILEWSTRNLGLLQLLPALVALKYNAALGFVLCGIGLISIAFGRARLAMASGIAAAMGLVVVYFGIDQPRSELLGQAQSSLSEATLVVGLLMALLLALAVHFARTARLRAIEAESAKQEMEKQISERKRAEEALRASQDYARSIVESSLDMIIAVDRDRKIVEFNKAAQETFGYRPEEILGKQVNILYADPQQGLAVNNPAHEKGQGVAEILNRRKNG
ncbi:MAG: PAS domain-containing protein, partial [Candidatus Binatia bacterium]